MKLSTFSRNSRTEWLNHNISLLELLIFTERKPVRWNGRVFFNRLENDPVDVDLSSGGISQTDVSRYLMSTLHQVLASQGARSNRRNDYRLYIGWYWVTKLFFFTQTKQTPRLNWRLLNLATELSNLTFATILSIVMSYFFMSKWVSFSDKKNKFLLRKQVLNFFAC